MFFAEGRDSDLSTMAPVALYPMNALLGRSYFLGLLCADGAYSLRDDLSSMRCAPNQPKFRVPARKASWLC